MAANGAVMGLDVGGRRIGVAYAEAGLRIAFPLTTLYNEAGVHQQIAKLCAEKNVSTVVAGLPRNQQGEETAQTQEVYEFVHSLKLPESIHIVFQDESLTSVTAESHLQAGRKPYRKEDVDALAASLILQDYLETKAGF